MQTGVKVQGDKITGKLKYVDTGALADHWGAGHFLALKFSNLDETATSVKVGLRPTEGSGLVELLGDPDMNCAAKITDPSVQTFRVETTDGTYRKIQVFDLEGLTLLPPED